MASLVHDDVQHPSSSLDRAALRFADDIRDDLAKDKLVWPSVPGGVLKVRKVIQDPDATAADVARAAAADPALSTKLVRVANSVYYGGSTPCRDLHSAVVRLGRSAIEHVVMVFVVAQVFSVGNRRRIQPHLRRLWRHSTLVAAISELVAGQLPHLDKEVAMLAGLTHDIGALPVLVRAERVSALISNRKLLGPLVSMLHCELGQAMLHEWRFPSELTSVVADHEKLSRNSGIKADYVDVVMVANITSHLDTEHPLGAPDLSKIPALGKVGLEPDQLPEFLAQAVEKEALLRELS